MKHFRYTALAVSAVLAAFTFQSCLFEQEDIFEESASQRLAQTTAKAQQVLVSASNGWKMYYYPHSSQMYGGYIYTMSFTDEDVTVTGEILSDPSETCTSKYKMTYDDGPVLSFDTNNYAFHYFATPSGSGSNLYGVSGMYQAFGGDFEFLILSAAPEEVVLQGKRTGNTIRMLPLSGDMVEYVESVQAMSEDMFVSAFDGTVGGEGLHVDLDLDYRQATLSLTDDKYADDEDGLYSAKVAYLYTDTGIKLYKPTVIGTHTFDELTWDSSSQKLVSTSGESVDIVGKLPEGWHAFDDFLGTWTMTYDGSSTISDITIEQDGDSRSFLINGMSTGFSVKASYNLGQGIININAQYVGATDTYDILMAGWDGAAGYVNYTVSGMNGTLDEEANVITWADDGDWGSYKCSGFILYNFLNGSRANTTMPVEPYRWANNTARIKNVSVFTRQ